VEDDELALPLAAQQTGVETKLVHGRPAN